MNSASGDLPDEPPPNENYLIIELLTRIWQRVTEQRSIERTGDFSSLVGDAASAARLREEIERETGGELPISTIQEAPTVASLAAQLRKAVLPPRARLVMVKPGFDALSLFMAHGLGGDVFELLPLGRRLQTNHRVYVVQGKGLDGADPPPESVEEMAEDYLSLIRGVQPHGPYFLLGISFGGLILYEVARRLSEEGEVIGLLAFLDTYPHPSYWPFSGWVWVIWQRAKVHLGSLARLGARNAIPRIVQLCQSLLDHLRVRGGATHHQRSVDNAVPESPLLRVRESSFRAFAAYRPLPYRGRILFLRAQAISTFPRDPTAVWQHLVETITVHTVPGDHLGMLREHVDEVASLVSGHLENHVSAKDLAVDRGLGRVDG